MASVRSAARSRPRSASAFRAHRASVGTPNIASERRSEEQPPIEAEYVFLDFAMALGWGGLWDGEGAKAMGISPFPPTMIRAVDSNALGGILNRIESIADSTVSDIVNRIPGDFLAAEQREVIYQGLLARRSLVRGLVATAIRSAGSA